MATEFDEIEVDIDDIFSILTGDVTSPTDSAKLANNLAALDAGRAEAISNAESETAISNAESEMTGAPDLDVLLAGLIETADYEGEADLASLGAMIESTGPDTPRGRRLSAVIDYLVAELSEESKVAAASARSLDDWPETDSAEIVIDPEVALDGIERATDRRIVITTAGPRTNPFAESAPRSPSPTQPVPTIPGPTRARSLSLEIVIEDPDTFEETTEREIAELNQKIAEWSSQSAAEILSAGDASDPELRVRLQALRALYAPKDFDAPQVRAKKHEVLAILLRALTQLSNQSLPSVELRAQKAELAKLELKRIQAPNVNLLARARGTLRVARSLVKGSDLRGALEALTRVEQTAPSLRGIVEVWRSYVRSLLERNDRIVVELARSAIQAEISSPQSLEPVDRAEAFLLLGRVCRRLGMQTESLEAFKRAYEIDPFDHETKREVEKAQSRRRTLSTMRASIGKPTSKKGLSG